MRGAGTRLRRRAIGGAVALLVALGATTAESVAQAHAAELTMAGTTLYIDYTDPSGYDNALAHAGRLHDVSVQSHHLTSAGGIEENVAGATDYAKLAALKAVGVRVQLMVSNQNMTTGQWDAEAAQSVMTDASARTAFVANTVALAHTDPAVDGIELDLESLAAADRDVFTATVQALATQLHRAGKTLAVSVFAKSTDQPEGFPTQQAQDWPAIGAVADAVRIQGYGYCWETGCLDGDGPGPIDPSFWVGQTLEYAVSVLPLAKITLAIPLYAIDYPVTMSGRTATRSGEGEGMTWSQVVRTLHRHRSMTRWQETGPDGQVASAYARYRTGGEWHEVRFSNRYTVSARVQLANAYGVISFAFWRAGGEDPGIWSL